MKPILPYSILLSIAISPLALATEYNAQILNYNGIVPNDGVVNVTSYTVGEDDSGAVHVNTNGINTSLQGKVAVTAAGPHGSGLYLRTGSGIVSSITVNNVTSDVNITTVGSGAGYGIVHSGNNVSNASKVTIDAGSDYDLNMKLSGTPSGWGAGVAAQDGGKIDITAKNVNIDYSNSGLGSGVGANGANAIVNITAEKVTAKAGYRGVQAWWAGVVNITGDLDVATSRVADGIGVYLRGTNNDIPATITVGGHTTVSGKAQYGVYGTYGTVTFRKGLTVNQTDLGATVAVYACGATVKDDIANGTGGTKYDISGQMWAQTFNGGMVNKGTIDLHMGAGSTFTGYTTKATAADVINLELSNGAQWTNTALSTMSNLNLLVNSTIAFNKSGTNTFYNINSAAVMLAEGSLLKVDLADTFTGDVTLFSGITTTTTTWNGGTDVENAILLNAAGTTKFIYTNPSAGVFRITGSVLVPEPTTASLTLLGLAALMIRRRRVTV